MRLGAAALVFAGLGAAAPIPQPGLTVETRQTRSAGITLTTTYVQDDRSREEWRHVPRQAATGEAGDVVAHIIRCDLRKAIVLSYGERSYMSGRLETSATQAFGLFGPTPAVRVPEDAPQLVIETETVRTGERKDAFGYTARRVITTVRHIPLDPKAGEPRETVTDGWYIDLETRPSCVRLDETTAHARMVAVVWREGDAPVSPRVAYREIGAPERGYAIEVRTTSRPASARSDASFDDHTMVTRLVRGPLDPALFEIPPGFRHAGGPLGALAERLGATWTWMRALFAAWFR